MSSSDVSQRTLCPRCGYNRDDRCASTSGLCYYRGETVEELGGREHTEGKYGYFVVNKTDNTNTRAVVLSLHPLEIEIVK